MKGFTIIELLLTMAMIAILTGITIPLYSISQSKDDLQTEASFVISAIRSAKIFSTSGKENSEWGIHFQQGKMIIFKGTSFSTRDISFDEEMPVGQSISFTGLNDIYFTKLYGIPSATGSITLSIPNGDFKNIQVDTYSQSLTSVANGRCGTASNSEHPSSPVTNLCAFGTASAVTGDGVPYNWTCTGESGGTTDSCEATKTGWINSGLGFYVMKYEAKNVSGVATSQTSSNPWVEISQLDAITACSNLGSGYHLINNAEWTALARNIEAQSSNWSGGIIGSGTLSRGYSGSVSEGGDLFTNTILAPSTGIGYEYNTGADSVGSTGNHLYKRTHTLSNSQIIWDLAGNSWEWNNNTCQQGSGSGFWYYDGTIWDEWNDINLSDYEKNTAGPVGNYTSINGVGQYYGCRINGNALRRGGGIVSTGSIDGVFSFNMYHLPTMTFMDIGFRCTR